MHKSLDGTRRLLRYLIVAAAILVLLPAAVRADDWVLWDWSAYVDGATYNPPSLPSSVDSSMFNFTTGLGSLDMFFNTPGMHAMGVYFSHYYDTGFGDVTDAYANPSITLPPTGRSFQLGWPGMGSPTVFDNFMNNSLDNSNTVGAYSAPPSACCDVAMAMLHSFTLGVGDSEDVKFHVGIDAPPAGTFYLRETDHDSGRNIYLTETAIFTPSGGNTVPEASCWQLLAVPLGILWCGRRQAAKKASHED